MMMMYDDDDRKEDNDDDDDFIFHPCIPLCYQSINQSLTAISQLIMHQLRAPLVVKRPESAIRKVTIIIIIVMMMMITILLTNLLTD